MGASFTGPLMAVARYLQPPIETCRPDLPPIPATFTPATLAAAMYYAVPDIEYMPSRMYVGTRPPITIGQDKLPTLEDRKLNDLTLAEFMTQLVVWEQLVRNIFYVCTYEGMVPTIAHTAVWLLHMTLTKHASTFRDLECLQTACVAIAFKLEQDNTIQSITTHLKNRMHVTRSHRSIDRMELNVLKLMGWKVACAPTPASVFYKYMETDPGLSVVEGQVVAVMDLALMDGRIAWRYDPELVCICVLRLVGVLKPVPQRCGAAEVRSCMSAVHPAFAFVSLKTPQQLHSIYHKSVRKFNFGQLLSAAAEYRRLQRIAAVPEEDEEANAELYATARIQEPYEEDDDDGCFAAQEDNMREAH